MSKIILILFFYLLEQKKNMFLILKWVLSVVQLDILVQKRSQTKNYLLFLRSSWYLTVVQQSKKSLPKMSLTDSKFWKMNSSLKSNKTKHSQLLSQFQNKNSLVVNTCFQIKEWIATGNYSMNYGITWDAFNFLGTFLSFSNATNSTMRSNHF